MCKLRLDSDTTGMNCNSLSLLSITKVFFTIQGTANSCNVLNYERPGRYHVRFETSTKHKKTENI